MSRLNRRVTSSGGGVEAQVREAGDQVAERDLSFQPGRQRAQAVVDAAPEGDVPGAAGEVEPVRVVEARPVPIGMPGRNLPASCSEFVAVAVSRPFWGVHVFFRFGKGKPGRRIP